MKATIEQRAEQALAGGQTLTQVRKSHAARPLEENLPIRRGRCGAGMASRGRMATPGITDAEVFGQMRGIFQCTRGTPGTAERTAAAHGGNLLRTSLSALPGRWAHPSPTARFRKTATLCGLWPVLAGPESSPRAARRREAAAVGPAAALRALLQQGCDLGVAQGLDPLAQRTGGICAPAPALGKDGWEWFQIQVSDFLEGGRQCWRCGGIG